MKHRKVRSMFPAATKVRPARSAGRGGRHDPHAVRDGQDARREALALVKEEPWRRWQLQCNAAHLRERLAAAGLSSEPSRTHIVPVILGDNERTMKVCEALLERGFYVQGIRHPSVPRGSARLRITPMATHTTDEIDALADCLVEVIAQHPPVEANG